MHSHRIMIVDDEAVITTQLEERLTSMAYDVIGTASSGEEAVDMARQLGPDAILMDIVMPGGLDGIDAAERIKVELDIPVIFLTAYTDDKFINRARNVEPFGYIVKPYQEKEIKATIEVALHKKDMERQLRESQETYRSVVNIADEGTISTDDGNNIISCSPACERMFGYRADELIGKPLSVILPKPFRRTPRSASAQPVPSETAGVVGRTVETVGTRKDGNEIPLELSTAVCSMGKMVFLTDIARDITQRKRAERDLRSSRDQLRNLSAHLLSTTEQERADVAREIRDELGQTLTVLKMDMSWLRNRLPKGEEALVKKAGSMSDLIDATVQRVRRLYSRLRLPLLDDDGLMAAIEWQTGEFQSRTGIKCEVAFDLEDIAVDQDRSTAIFRILQEALTNVARHSKATRARVSLKQKGSDLVLRVRDNGKGIAPDKISGARSFGLMEMRERAQIWGGDVKISGVPDKGTTVIASIPLEERKADDKDTRR